MRFLRCSIPLYIDGYGSGVAARIIPGRPGEAASIQTLAACDRDLRPLTGADGPSGLELGPPLQLYADPAARDGEPVAVRRPYTSAHLSRPVWDPYSSAIYVREQSAVVRLSSDDTVTVVAGAVEEEGDADGPGRTARFSRGPGHLASDGAGSLYLADGNGFRKLQLPPLMGPVAGQVGVQPQAAAGGGPVAALATAGGPIGGPLADQAGAAEVLVSTLVPRAPEVIAGLAFDGSGNGGRDGRSSSGSLLFMTNTALYRLPLGDPTAAPLLLARLEGAEDAEDGRGADARFRCIWGIAVDGEGSVYVADCVDDETISLRRVAADGAVTTVVAGPEGISFGLPAILPNGCLALCNHEGNALHVLGLGLKLPCGHAAAAPLPPAAPAGPPPRTLPADLRALLARQPDGTADVAIVVGDRTFHAHRVLLAARSDYFQQRLGGDFADGSAQQLSLPDADADAFEVVLGWVYTDTADIPAALAAGVAELADRLLLPELREQAVAVVEASVSASTVAALLLWAEARGPAFSALLSRLKGWYVENHEAVMRAARSPRLIVELMRDISSSPSKRARTL